MSLTFTNKEEDIIRLNNWMFDMVQSYIKGRTLELGSGRGGISSIFMHHNLPLHLSDEKVANREALRVRFLGTPMLKMIHDIDFIGEGFMQTYARLVGAFDTVIALNIAEHGFYDQIVLNNAIHLLRQRGHFVAIASSRAVLFNGMEQDLSGLKEYNYTVARELMGPNFEILKVRCFNWGPESESSDFSQFRLSTLAIFRKNI